MALTEERRRHIEFQVRDCGYVFNFGKHKGEELYTVFVNDQSYIAWLVLNTVNDSGNFHWHIDNDIFQGLLEVIENADYKRNADGSVYQKRKKLPRAYYLNLKRISDDYDASFANDLHDDFQILLY